MPSGACVIPYKGKRGVVGRIKYRDADGKQVQETIGAERDGITRKQAEVELRERLTRVEKRGYRRPKQITFGDYSTIWFNEGQKRRGWKVKTVRCYGECVRSLERTFGRMPLAAIRPRDIAAYVRESLEHHAPATVNLHITVLQDVLKTAKREELIDSNPAEGVER